LINPFFSFLHGHVVFRKPIPARNKEKRESKTLVKTRLLLSEVISDRNGNTGGKKRPLIIFIKTIASGGRDGSTSVFKSGNV
jgi:hypothetical protein